MGPALQIWAVLASRELPGKMCLLRLYLAVSSTEFCRCTFDEGQIGIRLGGGCGHIWIIPLQSYQRTRLETFVQTAAWSGDLRQAQDRRFQHVRGCYA
jgi:hypothetical protein